MACAAQTSPRTRILVAGTENILWNVYRGNQRSMLITNCIFRLGGVAFLLSNHPADRRRAKYRLTHMVRTHLGASDEAYKCAAAPCACTHACMHVLCPHFHAGRHCRQPHTARPPGAGPQHVQAWCRGGRWCGAASPLGCMLAPLACMLLCKRTSVRR